jgi:putative transposase
MGMPDSAADPTRDFQQLSLLFTDPIQHDYEVIRPIMLEAETVTARSQQTGMERTVVGDKARRFVQHGMLGLVDQRPSRAGRKAAHFPDPVARHLLYLKHLYPPIHDRELARIVERKFGYHTNHHTIRHFLQRHPIPVQLPLQWTLFHEFEDAYRARWTVVRLHYEGWHVRSIAGVLKLSERHVRNILASFDRDDFVGLEDQRSRPPDHPANQLTLPLLKEILAVQKEYPRAGRFRVQGILSQRLADQAPPSQATVGRAMEINRQFHDAPPAWVSDKPKPAPDTEVKHLKYVPAACHHYWYVDIRYLVRLDEQWIYSLCIIDGYSRQILAGMASSYQDSVAVLQLLYGAIGSYGCPLGLVSDNGSVFTGHAYSNVLTRLAIEPCLDDKGKPWENLIEAQFKVQLRLADAKFEQATTLDEVQHRHAEFVELFNNTPHWAHRDRVDAKRTPAQVLGSSRGRPIEPGERERIFKLTQTARTVNRFGYVSIQRFYVYAERGLARKRVAVWIYEGQLRLEYEQTVLAHYQAIYDRQHQQVQQIDQPILYPTPFRSPQLELWELDETQWLKVRERARWARRARQPRATAEQLALAGVLTLILLGRPELHELGATLLAQVNRLN